ncbi:MAG: indole-3-glycerol-phosphate synthase TrpC [Polyangiaceae bacterium]
MSWLAAIVESKVREVQALRGTARTRSRRDPLGIGQALHRGPGGELRLIAEVKLRSPSAGPLSRALDPATRAAAYAEAGAAMVSVLCDGPFFDGSWQHLSAVRERLDAAGSRTPLLAKEFVIDLRQIQEARDRGADAVLLIARIVDAATLMTLARVARDEGIEPFIEVVDAHELEAALSADARIVGVNARDLDTLAMDAARAESVLASIPRDVVAVHLSGLRETRDVAGIARGRADAALVGEALMRDDDPRPRLRMLVAAGRPPFVSPHD